jgi:hypothetical protein
LRLLRDNGLLLGGVRLDHRANLLGLGLSLGLVPLELAHDVVLGWLLLMRHLLWVIVEACEASLWMLLRCHLVLDLDSALRTVGTHDSVLVVHLVLGGRLLLGLLSWLLGLVEVDDGLLWSLLEALHTLMLGAIALDEHLVQVVLALHKGLSPGLPLEASEVDLLWVDALRLPDLVLGIELSELLIDAGVPIVGVGHLLELDGLSIVGAEHLQLAGLSLLLNHLLLMVLLLVHHAVQLPLQLLLLHVLRHLALVELVKALHLATSGLQLLLVLLLGQQLLHYQLLGLLVVKLVVIHVSTIKYRC